MNTSRVLVLCILLVTLALILAAGPIAVAPATPGASSDDFRVVDWPEPVQPNKVWTFSFSSPVDVLTVTGGRFVLLDASGGKLGVTMTTALDGLSVAVQPVQDLAPGDYRLQALPGLLDTSGRPIQEPVQVNFSVTAESTAQAQEDGMALGGSTAGTFLFGMMNDEPVDLAITAADVDVPALVAPGSLVSVRLTVHNESPGRGLAGGSVFRVLFDGRVVDEVPFYIPGGQDKQVVRTAVRLPAGPYKSLKDQERATVHVAVVVDPYGRTPETNEGNNRAEVTFQVRSDNERELRDTHPPMTVDASGLSVWSSKDDAANDIIQAALPGETLHLKARISCAGNDASEDINVKFLVDGIVILDHNRTAGRPSSGFTEATAEYEVPYTATGPLHFTVVLSNGSTAEIQVPVLKWDTEVRAGDLFWSGTEVAVLGRPLYLHAVVKNTSSLTFPTSEAKIACRVLVNGKPFYEHEYRLRDDELMITVPVYQVPRKQTGPVTFTVVTDVYDQLAEADESNNVATILIPLANNRPTTPDLWVGAEDLTAIARPVVPGSHVLLSAAIHNRSGVIPTANVKIQFKINDQVVGTVTKDRGIFQPMQAQLVTYQWIAPVTLSGNVRLTVVIDPDNQITEGSETNNSASEDLEMARPDLEPAAPALSWNPVSPLAGSPVQLKAVIRNNGPVAVGNAQVRFFANGEAVGTAPVSSIPATGAGVAVLTWDVPPGSRLGVEPWSTLTGTPGRIPLPTGVAHDFALTAVVDPEKTIPEADETNNEAGPATITATIPNEKKVLYVRLLDTLGGVPSATVVLQAPDGQSAQADSSDDGWCTFTGLAEGGYTLTISKEGYIAQTVNGQTGSQSPVFTKTVTLEPNGDVILTENDDDHDLLSDELEALYRTNPTDPDTDDDGVIDGKDLSPLVDPAEPVFEFLQQPGMVRLDQPIAAYGLDGWVEVWDMDFSLSDFSDTLVYSKTYESKGSRASTMSPENYRKAVDELFKSTVFRSYTVKDVSPLDIGYLDEERVADHVSEDHWTYPADSWHRTEYRFYYDYLVDYQVVSLKNESALLYPSNDRFFEYVLIPMQHLTGLTHCYRLQFTETGLASQIGYANAGDYHQLGLQYAFYRSNDFTAPDNRPFYQGVTLADTDGSDLFSCSITLPGDTVTTGNSFLKITPVWVNRAPGMVEPEVAPVLVGWNLTGMVRDVIYSQDANGNSAVGSYDAASFAEWGLPVRTLTSLRGLAGGPEARTLTQWNGFVSYDPSAAAGKQVTAIESDINILSYVGKGISGAGSGIEALVEKVVKSKNEVEKINQLPDSHWIKGAQYQGVLAGFAAVGGAVTAVSNGREAYLAFKEGDTITGTYYLAKTLTTVGETTNKLAKISKHVVAYSGKTGRFALLASEKVELGLTAAIGAIEMGYNAAKWQETTDPIQKSAYLEKTFAAGFDTLTGLVGVVYGPQMLAFQMTWMIGNELVFRLFGGSEIAYKVAESPSTAIVFIAEYWGEEVNSVIAETAYNDILGDLMDQLQAMNEFGKPFIPVFIDPGW